jgi:hypothetical protein
MVWFFSQSSRFIFGNHIHLTKDVDFWFAVEIFCCCQNNLCDFHLCIRILQSSSKKIKINHDFFYFVTSNDILSLKTDINEIRNTVSIKTKKNHFCWHLESHCQKEQDPDPDTDPNKGPYQNITDPEHW